MRKLHIIIFFTAFFIFNNDLLTEASVNFQVFKNTYDTYFLNDNGELWAYGFNDKGQFGIGTNKNSEIPIKISEDVSKISLTEEKTIHILKNDGTLWGTGLNRGDIGNGDIEDCNKFIKILEDVKDVKGCNALKKDGSLWGWSGVNTYSPQKIMDNVNDFYETGFTVLAIKNDDSLWIRGADYYGILGDIEVESFSEAIKEPLKIAEDVKEIKTCNSIAFILKNDDSLWGLGINSQRLLDSKEKDLIFPPIKLMDDVKAFDTSSSFFDHASSNIFVIKKDNSLWGWGSNEDFLLGDFDESENTYIPQKIMDSVKSVYSFHGKTVFVIKQDDSLWGWGENLSYSIKNSEQIQSGFHLPKYVLKPTKIMDNVNHFAYNEYTYNPYPSNDRSSLVIVTNDGRIWNKGTLHGYSLQEYDIEYVNPKRKPVEIFFGDDIEEKITGLGGKYNLYESKGETYFKYGLGILGLTVGKQATIPIVLIKKFVELYLIWS